MATDYASLKVPELKKVLLERGLAQTGNKADLIARLKENDEASSTSKPARKFPRCLVSLSGAHRGAVPLASERIVFTPFLAFGPPLTFIPAPQNQPKTRSTGMTTSPPKP